MALRDISPPDMHLFVHKDGVHWPDYGHHISLTRVYGWVQEIRDCTHTVSYSHGNYPGPHTLEEAWAIQSALTALNQ